MNLMINGLSIENKVSMILIWNPKGLFLIHDLYCSSLNKMSSAKFSVSLFFGSKHLYIASPPKPATPHSQCTQQSDTRLGREWIKWKSAQCLNHKFSSSPVVCRGGGGNGNPDLRYQYISEGWGGLCSQGSIPLLTLLPPSNRPPSLSPPCAKRVVVSQKVIWLPPSGSPGKMGNRCWCPPTKSWGVDWFFECKLNIPGICLWHMRKIPSNYAEAE